MLRCLRPAIKESRAGSWRLGQGKQCVARRADVVSTEVGIEPKDGLGVKDRCGIAIVVTHDASFDGQQWHGSQQGFMLSMGSQKRIKRKCLWISLVGQVPELQRSTRLPCRRGRQTQGATVAAPLERRQSLGGAHLVRRPPALDALHLLVRRGCRSAISGIRLRLS